MRIDKSVWWYWVPAQINDSALLYRNPRDICSLVRSLAWGWVLAIMVATGLCFVVGSVSYFLIGFWCAALGLVDNHATAMTLLVFGGVLNTALFSSVAIFLYRYYDVEHKIVPRRVRVDYSNKPPSLVVRWVKGLKEKTCVLVDYVD